MSWKFLNTENVSILLWGYFFMNRVSFSSLFPSIVRSSKDGTPKIKKSSFSLWDFLCLRRINKYADMLEN
jgi:hypothetical protein